MVSTLEVRRQKLEEIRTEVERDGGIKSFPMWRLRDACGWGKLGVNVVRDIASRLRDVGLGYLPSEGELPRDQYGTVHLYVKESPVGELVEAVLAPNDGGNVRLRSAAGTDAALVLQQIRALVCD